MTEPTQADPGLLYSFLPLPTFPSSASSVSASLYPPFILSFTFPLPPLHSSVYSFGLPGLPVSHTLMALFQQGPARFLMVLSFSQA